MVKGYKTQTITRYQEGASLEDMENGDAYETVYLVYNPEGELIWDTTNYNMVKQYFEDEEPRWYQYRIYGSYINGNGRELGRFYNDEYYEAEKHYLAIINSNIYDLVEFQLLDKKWGWVDKTLLKHSIPDFEKKQQEYYKRKEKEEPVWHAGDSKFEAPGMSVHDFIDFPVYN